MNKFYKYTAVIIIAFILQITILSFHPIAGVKPDLLLVIVIISSLLSGSGTGIKTGFGAGCLQDIFLGSLFGSYTISKFLVGSLAGIIEGKIFKKNYLLPPLIIFGATIFHEFLVIVLSQKVILEINYLEVLKTIILPKALYHGILGLILYPIFIKFFRFGDQKSWM